MNEVVVQLLWEQYQCELMSLQKATEGCEVLLWCLRALYRYRERGKSFIQSQEAHSPIPTRHQDKVRMTFLSSTKCLLLLLHWLSFVNPFLIGRYTMISQKRRRQFDQDTHDDDDDNEASSSFRCLTKTRIQQTTASSSAVTSLRFVANTNFTSHPVPCCCSDNDDDSLIKFLQNPNHRNHLLLGNKAPPAAVDPIISPSPKLWDRWRMESHKMGTIPPNPSEENDDEMVLVKSNKIAFPLGLELYIESIVGVKLLIPPEHISSSSSSSSPSSPPLSPPTASSHNSKRIFPEYQFTLIQDHVYAQGPKPLVWLHNQIMKAQRKSSNDNNQQQMTHSCSILQMKEITTPTTDDSRTGVSAVVFTYKADIEINVKVPKLLVKLLPMSREQCNQQGSAAMQKAFQTMGKPSLDNFVKSYELWMDAT